MKTTFLLLAALGLTACGDIANKNPNAFSSNVDRNGQITGPIILQVGRLMKFRHSPATIAQLVRSPTILKHRSQMA